MNTCNKYFYGQLSFDQRPCKTVHWYTCSHFVFVFVYIAWIYILFSFTNEKGELTILTTKHSLFVSYITQKVYLWQQQIWQARNKKNIYWPPIWATKHFVLMMHALLSSCWKLADQNTVPLKGKLTVPRNSILETGSSKTSRIEARVEFRDVRGRSRIYPVELRDFRVKKTKDFLRD